MERRDAVTVGDVLRECLEKSNMQGRLDEVRACDAFAAIVGPDMAARCSRPAMRSGMMTIGVGNAALRSELNMRRSAICAAINEFLGKEVVMEVMFRS